MQKEKKDVPVEEQEGSVSTEETEETTEIEEGVSEEDFVPKTDDEGEEGDEETSSDSEDDAASKEDDGEGLADELSLEDFDEPQEEDQKKTGVQKRIDKLTAEKKALEERLERLEVQTSKSGKQEYSEAQLRTALSKAMEDGDSNLMWEIMDYRISKARQDAVTEYQKENQQLAKQHQKRNEEWFSVVEEYSYLSDSGEPELYKGSHRDLNVSSKDSLLYKLAAKLYTDPSRAERYGKDGGQRLAVSDAIRIILRKKNAKVSSKETKQLKRQLAKEKQKSSVSSGKAVKAETSKPISHKTSLEEYMDERKKSKSVISGEI